MNHHITPGEAMFDLTSPTALDDLRGGVLSHLHTLVGLCTDDDRTFVLTAVREQFGLDLQVVSVPDAPEICGLMYPPQSWRGKARELRAASEADDRAQLEGFIRGLNYGRRAGAVATVAEDLPGFAQRRRGVA